MLLDQLANGTYKPSKRASKKLAKTKAKNSQDTYNNNNDLGI